MLSARMKRMFGFGCCADAGAPAATRQRTTRADRGIRSRSCASSLPSTWLPEGAGKRKETKNSPLVVACAMISPQAAAVPGGSGEPGSGNPTGRQQPATDNVREQRAQKNAATSPTDAAMERALNNICRGCIPVVPVGDVPRYDVARSCGAKAGSGATSEACVREESAARNQ